MKEDRVNTEMEVNVCDYSKPAKLKSGSSSSSSSAGELMHIPQTYL